ncbi:hypothetical protein SEUCBS140593_005421 [Sporothrix eucalyptigena]|uniref:Uncharacterized protein n=1 Tax=Sporothrix eucalyptigena TaxID=1812306 RepID=A0ABP0BWJ8_9PEZI
MAFVPGLLCTRTKITDPKVTDEAYNDWYTNKHLVDTVNAGLAAVGARYKNVNGNAEWPYLALYRLQDIRLLANPEFIATIPNDSPLEWGGAVPLNSVVAMDIKGYVPVGVRESQKDGVVVDGIPKVVVTQEWSTTESSPVDFQDSQLEVIKNSKGYRRSILVREAQPSKDGKTKLLTIHELDEIPAVETKDSQVWKHISDYGTGLYRIEPKKGRR